MANPKSQLRLAQMSGSLNDATSAVAQAHQIADTSLQGLLDHMATSVKNIQGAGFFASTASTLKDQNDQSRISYADGAGIQLGAEGDGSLAVEIGSSASGDKTLTAKGRVVVDDTTEATSTTDGSLQTDGGLSVAMSAVIGDDLDLLSDGAILSIGSTSKFALTDQGANNTVMASAGHRLAFGNAGEYISGDGTDLDIVSSGDLDITATLVDVTGALTVSGLTTATGRVVVDDATEATSTTDGSLQTDGGLSVAKSAVIGDDIDMLSDAAILSFGADKDVSLTHVADTGLLLNSDSQLQFGDSGTYIHQSADGVLQLDSDTEIELNATTIDMNGELDISGALTVGGNLTVTGDLDVNGTTTTIDVDNLAVEDELIVLNRSNSATPANDIGLVFQRGNGSSVNQANKAIIWDESEDHFAMIAADTEDGTTTGNVTVSGYAPLKVAALTAASLDLLDGNLSNAGDIDCDSISVADAANGLQIDFSGGDNQTARITIADNQENALAFMEGVNVYLGFDSRNGVELIDSAVKHAFSANIDMIGTTNDIFIPDNQAEALRIAEGVNAYMTFDTANAAEEVHIHKPLNMSDQDILNIGRLQADILAVDDSAVGLDVQFGGTTGLNKMTLGDNLADALSVKEAGNTYLKFVTLDGNEEVILGKRTVVDGAYLQVENASAGAGEIRIKEDADDGSNYVALSVPALSATYTLKFPAAAPADGQILKSDGSGNLDWQDQDESVGARDQKIVTEVSASITATAMALAEQGFDLGFSGDGHDLGVGGTEKFDLFVNGQMLVSGTSAADGDYKIHGIANAQGGGTAAHGCVFFFDLEAGDQITAVTYQ